MNILPHYHIFSHRDPGKDDDKFIGVIVSETHPKHRKLLFVKPIQSLRICIALYFSSPITVLIVYQHASQVIPAFLANPPATSFVCLYQYSVRWSPSHSKQSLIEKCVKRELSSSILDGLPNIYPIVACKHRTTATRIGFDKKSFMCDIFEITTIEFMCSHSLFYIHLRHTYTKKILSNKRMIIVIIPSKEDIK